MKQTLTLVLEPDQLRIVSKFAELLLKSDETTITPNKLRIGPKIIYAYPDAVEKVQKIIEILGETKNPAVDPSMLNRKQ